MVASPALQGLIVSSDLETLSSLANQVRSLAVEPVLALTEHEALLKLRSPFDFLFVCDDICESSQERIVGYFRRRWALFAKGAILVSESTKLHQLSSFDSTLGTALPFDKLQQILSNLLKSKNLRAKARPIHPASEVIATVSVGNGRNFAARIISASVTEIVFQMPKGTMSSAGLPCKVWIERHSGDWPDIEVAGSVRWIDQKTAAYEPDIVGIQIATVNRTAMMRMIDWFYHRKKEVPRQGRLDPVLSHSPIT